ncbi:hypothetical protein [Paraburkholderia sp. J10-1]|uniref:hypothetical protein n=1 Tax=Paraburkholderia sp. J10-1 TaxID=2805430 RepID=UPI002AB75EB1|nr:hypothetical protein [Paraburkholderia sp. J10-1]
MQIDPRSVAREIPGIFDEVFPQLTPGIVAHFNSSAERFAIQEVSPALLALSKLQRAMLFELGYSVGERITTGTPIDWDECVDAALRRQQAFFDARLPGEIELCDKAVAAIVGANLAERLMEMSRERGLPLVLRPPIPGMEWIASGQGDFSVGHTLIEVKCTAKRFSASDYRQVAIYWLLSYAAAIEGRGNEWQDFVLLNPRSGVEVSMPYAAFLSAIGSGRAKVDILQLFQSLVGSRLTR